MKLLELEVDNWARHEKLRIDLSSGLQISGRNGTGKSSILEAVRFIFSESSRGYAGKIRKGADHARVKLRLLSGKDTYSIEKRLFPKKPSTAVMWVNRNPVADNSSTVYAKLQEVIREDLLDKLVYVPQGSMTEIVKRLGVKGGRQEFDRLFGLDRLEKVYAGVNEEIKVKEAEHKIVTQQLARYPLNAAEEYDKEIKKLGGGLRLAEKKQEADKREQHILGQKIEQLEKKIADMKEVKKKKDALEKEINCLCIEEAGILKDIESAKNNLNLLMEKKKEAEKLEKVAGELKRYPGLRELLSGLENIESKLNGLGNLDIKKKELRESETELNKKYNLEMEYESLSKKIVDLSSKNAVLRQKIIEKNGFLRELSSLSGKASCPKCGQTLSPTHVLAEKKTAEEEIRKLEKDSKEYSFLLVAEQKKEAPLKKQLDAMRNLEAESKQKRIDYEKALKEKEKLSEECDRIKSELKKIGYKGESIREVEEKTKELQKIEGEIRAHNSDLSKEKTFEQKIAAAEIKYGDSSAKKSGLEKEYAKHACDDKLFAELEKKRDEIREQKNKLLLEAEKTGNQIREDNRGIDEFKAKKEEYQKVEKKEKELARETSMLKEARDIFHTDKGMIKYLREKYIRQLSLLLTQNFRKINQNPRYRDILFDKDYELEIKTKEGSFSVEQLSGGELVQIALALRMALLELLSPVRLLILDEPFGSLDKEHRESLGEALNKIGGEGQLIIVTHIPVDSLQLPQLELGGY